MFDPAGCGVTYGISVIGFLVSRAGERRSPAESDITNIKARRLRQ
jgi:hypothetical protein